MASITLLRERQKADNWRSTYLWMQGVFYFFQGFYFPGTGTYALVAMANWDIPTSTQVTIAAVLGLPTYLKMFPALLSDRVPIGRWGRRKPYITLGALLYIPGYALLVSSREFNALWVTAIILGLIAWVLVDSVLDAMVVDITPKEHMAKMQGAAFSARYAGTLLSTLLVPILGPRVGWAPVLVVLGICALVQSGAAFLFKEVPLSRETLQDELPLRAVFKETFTRPLVWTSILFMLFFDGSQGFGGLVNIYLLTELGWGRQADTMQIYGVINSLFLLSASLGAALIGRLPGRYFASLKTYGAFVIVFWILTTPWLLVCDRPENLVLIFTAKVLLGLMTGVGVVIGNSVAMRACPPSLEGFTFATLMSSSNLGAGALGPKTVTAFAPMLGGVIPAFFTLIPYGVISLVFLRVFLKGLEEQEGEAQPSARGSPGDGADGLRDSTP